MSGQRSPIAPQFTGRKGDRKALILIKGILVIETGHLDGVNVNALIEEVREKRIQDRIGQVRS
jgi:hypothetical protein